MVQPTERLISESFVGRPSHACQVRPTCGTGLKSVVPLVGFAYFRLKALMDTPKDQLIAYEKATDEKMKSLAIASLPAHAVISRLHTLMFYFINIQGSKDKAAWKTGDTMSYRLSYLIPWLRACNTKVLGASTTDMLQEYSAADPDGGECRDLLIYAHFCEWMPDVHRGRLNVERTDAGFRLDFPSPRFALAEATDIIISELALNHVVDNGHHSVDEDVLQLARNGSPFDEIALNQLIARYASRYRKNIREARLVGDEGMRQLFGFDLTQFAEIQSVVLGMAHVFSMLSLVLWVWSEEETGEASPAALDCVSVCLDYEGFLSRIEDISKVPRDDIERFTKQFTLDYNAQAGELCGGDGFTPPFMRLSDGLVFSPDLVFRFIHPRNALAHAAKTQRALFDELISHELEPTLIDAITNAFVSDADVIVRRNVPMPGGEIDLLIADSAGTHVIVLEVKAPLPPQGSRPTARLATRIVEGLDQLARLRAIPDSDREQIFSHALGVDIVGARTGYMIVARSCFGAIEVWQDDANVVPATLPLIQLASQRIRERKGSIVPELEMEIVRLTQTIIHEANPKWVYSDVTLNGQRLETPQLRYDEKVVRRWMERAALASPPL
jgi:hypothetical protein